MTGFLDSTRVYRGFQVACQLFVNLTGNLRMSKSLKMAAGNDNQGHSVVTISQRVQGRVVITPLTLTACFHTQGPNPAFSQLLHGSQPTANINRVRIPECVQSLVLKMLQQKVILLP